MAFDFDFFALIYKRAVLEMSALSLVESLAETRVHHNLNGMVSLKCVALQCTYLRVPQNIHPNIQHIYHMLVKNIHCIVSDTVS